MKNKKIYLILSLVLISLAAFIVLAFNPDTAVSGAGLASPIPRQNISGNFLLNVTSPWRTVAAGADMGNFTNVTVSFINGSGSWVFNITLTDNNTEVNQTFNRTFSSIGILADSVYNITINATNASDGVRTIFNQSAFKTESDYIIVDNTAPNMTIHSPTNGSFIGATGSFLMNATIMNDTRLTALHFVNFTNTSGHKSNYFNASNPNENFWNATINTTELTEGENYLYFNANDTAGNLNNSNYVRVYVDTTVPTVNIRTPGNKTWTTSTTPVFAFNFTDNTSPNASCSLYFDSGTVSSTNVTTRNSTATTLTAGAALTLGIHTWGVNCTDLGGNQIRSSVNFTIDIVERPTITSPANNSWIPATGTTNYTINGTSFVFNYSSGLINTTQDNNVSCELFILNATGQYNNTGFNISTLNATSTTLINNQTLTQGYNISFYVNCTYNATSILSEPRFLNVDTVAPSVYLQYGQTLQNWTWTTDQTPDLTYNFTDSTSRNATCNLFVDQTAYNSSQVTNQTATTVTVNTSLSIGVHSWYVNCTDNGANVGNSQTNSPVFYLDVVSPITVVTPSNNSWTSETRADNVSFSFNFTSGFANTTRDNNLSCELFITNSTGHLVKNGVNTTALNNTHMTIRNNNTLVNALTTNWTVNCTYNASVIQLDNTMYRLNVDNSTPTLSSLGSSGVTDTTATLSLTTSEAATCRYAGGSNVGYSAMTSFSTTGSTSHSTLLTGLSAGTAYTYYVRCQDSAANEGSGSTAFTTSVAPSGGGGSGGAGGGVPVNVAGTFAKEVWTSINAGETATVEVSNGAIGVTEVSFAVDQTTYGAWVKVERVETIPATVSSFTGEVYKNVKITESNVQKFLKDDKATIDFKVTKTWLSENKLSTNQVAMFRYVNNAWTELKTTLGEDDGTYVHYSAETPGFSYFVIGSKTGTLATAAPGITKEAAPKLGETAPAAGEEAVVDEAGEDFVGGAKKMNWAWLVPIGVLILALIGLAWLYSKKR